MQTEKLSTRTETNDRDSGSLIDVRKWRDQRTSYTRQHGKMPTWEENSRKRLQS